MMIKVLQYNDVIDFLKENEELMLVNESLNNLILGLADRMLTLPEFGDGRLFYAVINNGEIVGQALRSHVNKPLAITEMKQDEIIALSEELKDTRIELDGVVGPLKSSEQFAMSWKEDYKLDMYQGIYELTNLILPDSKDLLLHKATLSDMDVCKKFLRGFIKDAFPDETDVENRANEIATRNVKMENLYLLQNQRGQFVSMAGKVRESKNAGTVSLVYTPSELRSNGYGSLVTALVSREVLRNGKEKCNLFTDLTNPTSNSIYSKIGYNKIGENKHFSFS